MIHQEIIRKVQKRRGSFVVTIPKKMAESLKITSHRYVRITARDGRIILDLIPANNDIDAESDGYSLQIPDNQDMDSRLDTLRM